MHRSFGPFLLMFPASLRHYGYARSGFRSRRESSVRDLAFPLASGFNTPLRP